MKNFDYGDNPIGASGIKMIENIVSPDETVYNMSKIRFSNPDSDEFSLSIDSTKDGDKYVLNGDFITEIGKIIRSVAMVLVIATFAVSFMQEFFEGHSQDYTEVIIRKFAILGISIAGIFLIQRVAGMLINVGTDVSGIIMETANNGGSTTGDFMSEDIVDSLKSIRDTLNTAAMIPKARVMERAGASISDYAQGTGLIIQAFLPWVITKVGELMIKVTLWARAIEALVVVGFAPIAFVDLTGHSATDKFMHFIKNVFAIAIQGAIARSASECPT